MFDTLASFLFSYLLHSTVLIALALGAERAGLLRRLAPGLQETVWRWALFGALLTAGAQPLLRMDFLAEAPASMPSMQAMPHAPRTMPASPVHVAEPRPPAQADAPSARALLQDISGPATALWLLGAGSGLAWLLLQFTWLRVIVRRMPLSQDAALLRFARQLSDGAGLGNKVPSLRVCARWTSPLVTPGGEVCLPLWAGSLSPAQREAVLAHEIAHLLRRDPAWRFAAQAMARLGWLQPLNRIALQRLDVLAESACDRWSARTTGNGHALAESLYLCAVQLQEKRRQRRAPGLAAAMSRGRRTSPLLQRMRSLLEDKAMSEAENESKTSQPAPRRGRWLIAGGVLLAAVVLPAVVISNASAHGDGPFADLARRLSGSASHYLHLGGDDMRITSSGPEGTLKIHVHGKLQFSEAEDDVQSLSGSLSVDDERQGKKRQLVMEMGEGKDAAIRRVYKRDGTVIKQMDADDRKWLAGIVSTLIDASLNPAERVERLIARGGLEAVFTHIETQARDDFRRRSLIEALLARGPLDTAALDRSLALIDKIRGGFDRRTALQAVLASQTLGDAQQQQLLRSVATLGADFDSREVLVALSPKLSDSEAVLQAWVEAVKAIRSDFDARTALESLVAAEAAPDAARIGAALQASLTLDGDFDHRSALQAIARRLDANLHAAQLQAYADSAARIRGGFDRREALVALLEVKGLDKAALMSVLNAAENMGGFETLQLLQATAQVMPADAELIARYRKLARSLGDHERGQAEKALDRFAS